MTTKPAYFKGDFIKEIEDVTLYAVWEKEVRVGAVLANINSPWYSEGLNGFTGAYSPQCAWYAIGRVGEVHGVKVKFDTTIYQGEEYRGSGGWWVKNIKPQADIAMLSSDGKSINIDVTKTKNVNVITASNATEHNVKKQSIACFLFYVAGGYHGHVIYIEDVKRIDGVTNILFSDSNSGRATGSINERTYEDFIKMYDRDANGNLRTSGIEGEPIFQGFVNFD